MVVYLVIRVVTVYWCRYWSGASHGPLVRYVKLRVVRRHLHCSEITACVLYGRIPSFWSFISRFYPGSYLRFELPVNRYRRKCLSILIVTCCFCPNCSGSSVSKAIHSHDKVRQPCLYFKDSEGVFVVHAPGMPETFSTAGKRSRLASWHVRHAWLWKVPNIVWCV